MTVDELLHGMIVQSGNDATVALAEGVAGSEEAFVQRMNEQAARLGHDPYALRQRYRAGRSRTTTRPSAICAMLAVALIRDYPEYFPMYAIKEYTYSGITQRNRNELLFRDPFVDGLKTGHTEAAATA